MDYETSVILTREQIRLAAKLFRKMFKIRTILFPVMKVLDLLENKFSSNLYYYVDEDENFDDGVMAALETEEDDAHFHIRIRRTVYDKALIGDRASLGYICHEMCHFILIYVLGIGPKQYTSVEGLSYARSVETKSLPAYQSMEWQAMALCGEVMIPYERCINYSLEKIIKKTQSSTEQAKYFLSKVVKGEKE